jgi:hypothetical protein
MRPILAQVAVMTMLTASAWAEVPAILTPTPDETVVATQTPTTTYYATETPTPEASETAAYYPTSGPDATSTPVETPTPVVTECPNCEPYSSPDDGEITYNCDEQDSTVKSSTTFTSIDPTNGCTTNFSLPPTCVVHSGGGVNAAWLRCFRENGREEGILFNCLYSLGIDSECDISEVGILGVTAACNGLGLVDRILCVMNQIRSSLNGNTASVCRHYARCFKKIWEQMGYSQTYTTRWVTRNGPQGEYDVGHTWNEVPSNANGNYYVDAYNNILYWCP